VFVADNASNIQAAINKLPQLMSLSCFDHTLQLAVNDAVKHCTALDETVKKAKSITTYFKHSSINTKKLVDFENQMGLPVLKLKQECPTRWNSRYDMLERLVTLKDPVSAIAASAKKLPSMSADDCKAAEEYVRIFKPFKVLTAVMSSATTPTVSMIIPQLNKLKYTLSLETFQSVCLPAVLEDLLSKIAQRWPYYEEHPILAIATIVDPRYKNCGFEDAVTAVKAKDLVFLEMINNFDRQQAKTDDATHPSRPTLESGLAFFFN